MIAIDTNVLVRYLTQDDPKQFRQATRLLKGNRKVLIDDLVLVEAIWVLTGKRYRAAPDDICVAVESLISEPNVRFQDSGRIWVALSRYRRTLALTGHTPDFADILICERTRSIIESNEEPFEGWFTFDKGAQRIDGARPLSS